MVRSEQVQTVLDWWCPRVRECLGDALRGVSLYGSLPLGGYEPRWSDIDVCVLLETPVAEVRAEAVVEVHRQTETCFFHGGDRGQFIEAFYSPAWITGRPGAAAPCLFVGTGEPEFDSRDPCPGFDRYMLAHHSRKLLGNPSPFVPDTPSAMAREQRWLPRLLARPATEHSPIMLSGLLQELARTIVFFRDGRFLGKSAALEAEIRAGDDFADAYRIALVTRQAGSARAGEFHAELRAAYDSVATTARFLLEELLTMT